MTDKTSNSYVWVGNKNNRRKVKVQYYTKTYFNLQPKKTNNFVYAHVVDKKS